MNRISQDRHPVRGGCRDHARHLAGRQCRRSLLAPTTGTTIIPTAAISRRRHSRPGSRRPGRRSRLATRSPATTTSSAIASRGRAPFATTTRDRLSRRLCRLRWSRGAADGTTTVRTATAASVPAPAPSSAMTARSISASPTDASSQADIECGAVRQEVRAAIAFRENGRLKQPMPGAAQTRKRIAPAFLAEPAARTVAADEADLVAERQKLLLDRADQRGMVAARQVGAPDRAAEQHVADMGELRGAVVVDDMARRVARAMQHLERRARRTRRSRPR